MAEYTEPKLRKRLKQEIQAGDKGGKPGQWSARKSQLLVQRYEAEGGGYEGPKDERQRHLEQWGQQDWHGRKGGRYLPDAAWKLLTKDERKATEQKKRSGEEQRVANTRAAKEARAAAELLDLKAGAARKAIAKMDRKSELKRARKAETQLGKSRKTVLAAIDARRKAL